MNENSMPIMSDLAKIDAHVITDEEYEELPELTKEWFDKAETFINGKPAPREQADAYIRERFLRGGRPLGSGKKQSVTVRLDADVLAALRNQGRGWQTRMNETLRQSLGL